MLIPLKAEISVVEKEIKESPKKYNKITNILTSKLFLFLLNTLDLLALSINSLIKPCIDNINQFYFNLLS